MQQSQPAKARAVGGAAGNPPAGASGSLDQPGQHSSRANRGKLCVPWAVTVAAVDSALEKGEAGPGALGAGGSQHIGAGLPEPGSLGKPVQLACMHTLFHTHIAAHMLLYTHPAHTPLHTPLYTHPAHTPAHMPLHTHTILLL